MKHIYLDSASATRPMPLALGALSHVPWGNPNSSHADGQMARQALDHATAKIMRLIGATSGTVHYFPTATAAAQSAIYSAIAVGYATIRYDTEHHSVGDHTFLQTEIAESRPANGHFLHCRMLANNEVGTIYPPVDLPKGDFWLCDATAAMGHIPINVEQLGCHYIVGDSLKFNGIPGCAFVWVADGCPWYDMVEGGTPSVGLICAMASALEWHYEHMAENEKKLREMQWTIFSILDEMEESTWNTPQGRQVLPHILNISFSGVDGKALALMCSKRGVMVSAGAACTSGNNEPSHVLMAMYGDEARARSAIRISLSHENTPEECVEAAKIIADCVTQLRAIS